MVFWFANTVVSDSTVSGSGSEESRCTTSLRESYDVLLIVIAESCNDFHQPARSF